MRTNIRGATLSIITAGVIGISGTAGYAQSFPSRPVKLLTDVGTGGTYDIFARTLGEELHKRWGVGVIVEPHPGGNAVIGTRACAEASPDGYILCILSNQGLVANEFLYKKLPYSRGSFSPVICFETVSNTADADGSGTLPTSRTLRGTFVIHQFSTSETAAIYPRSVSLGLDVEFLHKPPPPLDLSAYEIAG